MNRVWGRDVAPPAVPQGAAPAARPPWIVWAGLAVVLASAAILSFDALRGLAVAVSIPASLAGLLPIVVDAGAAVSCAVWLGGRSHLDAARFAGRMTWALLAVTVAANAGQLGMHAHGITPPWWVAVAVGAIPPAVVGSTVHLVVLLIRTTTAVDSTTSAANSPVDVELPDEPAVEDDLVVRARELVDAGAGRPTLAKELSISDYRAGQLLKTVRTTNNGTKALT